MKRFLFYLFFFGVCCVKVCGQLQVSPSLHSLNITTIDGGVVHLDIYSGKKVLFYILPISVSDSSVLREIDSFTTIYSSKVQFIGVLSREDGYLDSNKNSIKNFYQSLGNKILLTSGIYTRKTSNSNQSEFMAWLTKKYLNKIQDKDAAGIGHKFFIDEGGRLYSDLLPQIPLFSTIVEKNILRKPAIDSAHF